MTEPLGSIYRLRMSEAMSHACTFFGVAAEVIGRTLTPASRSSPETLDRYALDRYAFKSPY